MDTPALTWINRFLDGARHDDAARPPPDNSFHFRFDIDQLTAAQAPLHKRMQHIEVMPGEPAPVTGRYEELNVLGARTGKIHHVYAGQPLPPAPRNFSWRLVQAECSPDAG